MEFNCRKQKNYDQYDKVIDSDRYAERNSPSPGGSEPSDKDERAAWLAAQHDDSPQIVHFDPMGRPFLVEDNNNDTSTYKTRTEFDIRGNAVKLTNALDQETVYEYAPVSLAFSTEEGETPIYTDSPDSGYRCMLNNAAGLSMRSWDERGHEIYNEYDELLRPEKTWLGPSGSKKLVNLLEYGEGQGSTNNLKGQLFRQYDQSGRLTNVNFDFKGNLVEMERRLGSVSNVLVLKFLFLSS